MMRTLVVPTVVVGVAGLAIGGLIGHWAKLVVWEVMMMGAAIGAIVGVVVSARIRT